jgi:Lrp/AsnC family leucine-responsive transcriptional regulator
MPDAGYVFSFHAGFKAREERIFLKMAFMETLDKFDVAILNELQADGRLTNTELAQRVGPERAPCWRRVRALEEGGYITGYRAEINRHKIGLGVMAFVRLDAERNNGDGTRAARRGDPPAAGGRVLPLHQRHGTFELQVVEQDLDSFSRSHLERLINLAQRERPAHQLFAGRGQGQQPLPLLGL